MLPRYEISIFVLFGTLTFLSAGELLAGTSFAFVAMMAGTLFSIAITYNLLGGLSTFSGLLFTAFALRTVVISQFAKVILFEPADKNIEVPMLTMGLYLLFYFMAMLGCFVYGRIRFPALRPLEPMTQAQSTVLYWISLTVGVVATYVFEHLTKRTGNIENEYGTARSLGNIFSSLLFFALVVAIDNCLQKSEGKHSFNRWVALPWIATMTFGFFNTMRGTIITPAVIYFICCYVRGYQFKRRHYIAAILGAIVFVTLVSPFEMYSRELLSEMPFDERVPRSIYLLMTVPSLQTIQMATDRAVKEGGSRENYYSAKGTFVVSRLSGIRSDSNLIEACANGFHYGWTAVKIELLYNIPRFLYKNKPTSNAAGYIGRVSGMNADTVENNQSAISPISDAYGAFDYFGVAVFAFIVFPLMFSIYESTFDMSRPWGSVALGLLMTAYGEAGMGVYVVLAIRTPVYLFLLSHLVGSIVRIIPMRGDR